MTKKPEAKTIEAWVAVLRTSKALLEQVERDLKEADLPPLSWYDVLWELHNHRPDGVRQSTIAKHLVLPKHNLSRLLDRLEARGLVERLPCEQDSRGKRVHLNDEGVLLLKKMWPVYAEGIQQTFADKLSREEQATIASILTKLTG